MRLTKKMKHIEIHISFILAVEETVVKPFSYCWYSRGTVKYQAYGLRKENPWLIVFKNSCHGFSVVPTV